MKKTVKWILLVILIIILAIDVAGFWKYKLRKSTNTQVASETSVDSEQDVAPAENSTDSENTDNNTTKETSESIEYEKGNSKNFVNGEKLFIKNISLDDSSSEEDDYTTNTASSKNSTKKTSTNTTSSSKKYKIQGLIYEEYEITKQEYTNLKSGKSNIEILGIIYSKDEVEGNNLKLKSSNSNSKKLYIKYDSKTKKYVIKDSTTDYSLYKQTQKYIEITVNGNTEFDDIKNGKKTSTTVGDVESSYSNIKDPGENEEKINLSTFTFNKKGVCTKISEVEV